MSSHPNYKVIDPLVEKIVKECKEKKLNVFNSLLPLENIFISLTKEDSKKNFDETKMKSLFEKIPYSEDLIKLAGFEKVENSFILPDNIPSFVLHSFLDSIRENMYQKPKLHKVKIGDQIFKVSTRYEIKKTLGKGAYGIVVEAFDKVQQKRVAIKKILNTFENGKTYQKRILREIKVMKHFRNVEGLISLDNLVPPESFEDFEDIYIVMDLMDGDLRGLIRNPQQALTDDNIQYFLYQLLLGVHKIHSANVLHRDLKPSNILLNAEMDLCICDFGLSRGIDAEDPTQSTLYVATRWYRAPELLLQYPKSSKSIDLWSVGCIFGELLQEGSRRPLFPGQNYLKQIDLILDRLGTPKEEEMKGSEKALKYLKGLPLKLKKKWENKFPKANPIAIDLLEKLLKFDPAQRITAEEALKHEYLSKIYDEEDLIDIDPFEYQFDDSIDLDADKDAIKKLIFEEIVEFNKKYNHIFGDAKFDDDEEMIVIEELK
eukprot:gene1467-12086_t